MDDKTDNQGGVSELSPHEEELRLLERERRSWLIWTFGIGGAIAAVVIAGTIMIAPWPDPGTTGSTQPQAPVETPAP